MHGKGEVRPAEAFTGQETAKSSGYNRPLGKNGVVYTPIANIQDTIIGFHA